MKRMAIFGSRGYLGSQLISFLSRSGWDVDGYDMPLCDVSSQAFWMTFEPAKYESILFFVGKTGTEASFQDANSFMQVNEFGLLQLLRALAPLGSAAPYVVFPSSRLVYRGAEHALKEDDPKEARTVYAANKIVCESLLQAYGIRYGIPYSIIRICVPYGNVISHDYSYGTIGFFVKQATTGCITLYGDGQLRRTFTYVGDICEVVKRLVAGRVRGTFNVGGIDMTLRDAASAVAESIRSAVRFVPWPDIALKLESGSTYFDSTQLADAIGLMDYRPFIISGV